QPSTPMVRAWWWVEARKLTPWTRPSIVTCARRRSIVLLLFVGLAIVGGLGGVSPPQTPTELQSRIALLAVQLFGDIGGDKDHPLADVGGAVGQPFQGMRDVDQTDCAI